MSQTLIPIKDKQTVNESGEKISSRIKDLILKKLPVLEDKRGELIEIFRPSWGISSDPLVYAYQVLARPGSIRGWVVHKKQDDRLFCSIGVLRWAFFDARPESPTYKMLNEFTVGVRNPVLLIIPKGVFHAVKNIGQTDAIFINLPTRAYEHADPDKFRLPIKNDLIPFDFDD